MPNTPRSMEEVYGQLLAGVLQTQMKLDALLNTQAEILAELKNTSQSEEMEKIINMVESFHSDKKKELGLE